MRSSRIVGPLALAALILSGCGTSGDQVRRTSTVVVTVDATDAPSSNTGSVPAVTIPVNPGSETASTAGSSGSGSQVATTDATETAEPTTETAKTTEPDTTDPDFKNVNPLKANCAKLLTVAKIKSVTGKVVPNATGRIVDVANPERKITGRLKCQYGVEGSSAKVTVNLTQFKDAAAADTQVATTVSSEDSFGAIMSKAEVSGLPAEVALRDGGLVMFRYDDWTLSVVLDRGMGTASTYPKFLVELAETALAGVL